MNNVFLDRITDRKDLLKIEALNINKFLLENNLKQIEDIQSGLAGLHYSYYENPSIYDYILKNKPINETIIRESII